MGGKIFSAAINSRMIKNPHSPADCITCTIHCSITTLPAPSLSSDLTSILLHNTLCHRRSLYESTTVPVAHRLGAAEPRPPAGDDRPLPLAALLPVLFLRRRFPLPHRPFCPHRDDESSPVFVLGGACRG